MKRSEMIRLLIPKVVSPFEVIKMEYYENGVYEGRAVRLLDFLEQQGMLPPSIPYMGCPGCEQCNGSDGKDTVNEWESE